MSPPWNKFWRTAVLLPLSFLLSTIFNVRRMEDSSYALWSTLLLQLCDVNLDIFIICPQYALYVSPKAKFRPDDSFSSTLTEADNQAKGVVVDNCLIIPEIRLSGRGPKAVEGDDDGEDDDEGDEDDDVGAEDSKFDKPTSPNQAEVVQRAHNKETSKNEQMERMKKRERLRDESWQLDEAKKKLGEFIDSVGEGPYTMAQLDKCSELVLGTSNFPSAPFCH
ncbi:hypothetical protein PLEOSDRAFT_162818 [Pleurotus ostreatus PC15]|uniref:Uncharacterized protein n=1 Tax=Pleurotus ostreatus (strain PC15) TaxID=1137138 RepID=A0A067N5M7_PLEO1|nr:hypothetical protein PLEOSDRAFT_162818 [Pleurotus ostreatus PC15]